jgi:Rps23 Pro-64 3,4-dihydroxylase Tpa1-like proline 4-hydroxylase
MWRETEFLFDKLGDPNATNAALEEDGETRKKSGKGAFLDSVYSRREYSDLLNITRKIFHDEEIRKLLISAKIPYFNLFMHCNWDSTLIQYYEDGDYYKQHDDSSIFTAIYTFYKEPKKFEGGDLYFEEYNYTLPVRNNQLILFPSIVSHGVTEVTMKQPGYMNGRFSIANLILWKT